jgi:hypothetical protein
VKNIPTTFDVKIYLYLVPGGGLYGCTTAGMEAQGWVLLSAETKTMAVPPINPVQAELDQLENQETAVRARFDEAMGNIKGRRAELLALEWQPERGGEE